MIRPIKDHKGDEVEVTHYTVYHGYAYQVECPHCGASEGENCVETTHRGPVAGAIRSPHQERAELAHEIVVGDDLRTDGGVDEDGDRRIHYRDICPDCGQVGESLGLAEIEAAESVCAHHRCDECGAEWYCPTGRSPEESNGNDLRTDGGRVDRCRECGTELGAGYLCDGCDTVEGWE